MRKQPVETELDIEVRTYVAAITDERIATGILPDDARRQA